MPETATRILFDVGDASAFAGSVHPAAYADTAPATRRSGTSIKGEHPPAPATASSNARSSSPPSPP